MTSGPLAVILDMIPIWPLTLGVSSNCPDSMSLQFSFVHPTGKCFISAETPIYVSAWALGLGKLDEIWPEFPAAAIMYGNSSEEKNSPHPPQQ